MIIIMTALCLGMSKLCFIFYLLCYALIPELLPIMLFKMCLLFLNYAAIQIIGSCIVLTV